VSVTKFKTRMTRSPSPTTPLRTRAGVWSRDANTCYRMGRAIKRDGVDQTAITPTAARGLRRYKPVGHRARGHHKMMMNHYQQTKNMLVSYSRRSSRFF